MSSRTLEELQKQYNQKPQEKKRGAFGGRRHPPHEPRNTSKPKDMKKTIGRLSSYLAPYKFRLILVVVCILISTVASLMGAYIMRPIINGLVGQKALSFFGFSFTSVLHYLAAILVVVGIVYLIGVVSSYLQFRLMLSVTLKSIEKIRNELFQKLEKLPVRFFDGDSNGEIMSRFTNDVDNIDVMLHNTVISLFSGSILLLGTFGMMLVTNIWLTLVTVFFVPVFLKLGGFIAKKSGKYYIGQQAALGTINGYIEETVSGQKVVKVFNHEETCLEEFSLLNQDLRQKQFKAQFYGGIMGPVLGNTSQISYALTAGLGGVLCLHGLCDIGALAVFVNYSRQFTRPIDMISQQMSTIFAALAGAERVFAIMDSEPETEEEQVFPEGLRMRGDVVLKDVTFGYDPEKVVLKGISLYAHPGQKIAFVGSTGAGKTTVTNVLNRFYEIDKGTITIDDIPIQEYKLEDLRKNIAMVLQDTHLFTDTVMENIRYGRPDATDEEVMEAAKMVSAHNFIMRLGDGYQTVLKGAGANLSQGQRQLLNIARAALSKAPILVLDEATSSVDTRTERLIEKGMQSLMKDRTTFVIAHRLSTVRNADAIMVLEQGEIIERGNHEDLLAQRGRYYDLYVGKKELD